jgi:hypothetical protein
LSQLDVLIRQYFNQLPVYLLARCPICGGQVWEAIDTFSLNGIGWGGSLKNGYGWMGSGISYDAECEHAKIVSLMVNLNGWQPSDVKQEVWIGSERPFVMTPILNMEKTFAVIHSLPIEREDIENPSSYYTAYFVTYFTDANEVIFDHVMQPAYDAKSLVLYDWADYNLVKWVEKGKLYWLNKANPILPLQNKPIQDFPYFHVKG